MIMLLTLFTKVLESPVHAINPCVVLLTPKSVQNKDGSISRFSEFRSVNVPKENFQFSSSDFSVSYLQSVGALSKLTTTYMSNMHDMNLADKFESLTSTQDV